MKTYICEFELIKGKKLNYRTLQLSFTDAQSAFGSYIAKNRFMARLGWKWRIAGSKEYLN